MKFVNGVHKSKYDDRDWLVKSFLKDEELPLRGGVPAKDMTPVRSQGNEGACVLFALASGIMEYQNNVLDYPEYKKLITLSPRLPYEEAKRMGGFKEGCTLKDAVTVCRDIGTCIEREWPYIANDVGSPHPKAYENALKFRLRSFARITNIKDLKGALNDPKIKLILAGVEVYDGMINTKNGVVNDPSCWSRKKGNHGICINYYDDTYTYWKKKGGVQFKNSWGEKWALDGYGFLSYTYLEKHMIDAFAVMDIDDPNKYEIETVGMLPYEENKILWV